MSREMVHLHFHQAKSALGYRRKGSILIGNKTDT